jgi:prepilin-type N-terminal cleavage/methylation domain-containing protein
MTGAHHAIPAARSRRRATRARRAFTLLEILIVVGVILILASLVVGVSSALLKRAERSSVENAMAIVESALGEYEATVGRPMTYDGATVPLTGAIVDVREPANPAGLPANGVIVGRARGQGIYALNLMAQTEATKPILAGIPTDLYRPDRTNPTYPASDATYAPSVTTPANPRGELVDTWGNRIVWVFPGRPFRFGVDTGLPDPDGTVRTTVENLFGVCTNRRICLVSAGPDGLFGFDLEVNPNLTVVQRTAAQTDNVFSYQLDPPN